MTNAGSQSSQPIGAVGSPLPNWRPPEPPPRTALAGRFCRVEPLDPVRHLDSLFAANALDTAGKGWTYFTYGPFTTLDAYRAWLEDVATQRDPQFYAIVPQGASGALGVASYLRINPPHGSIEVGHIHYSPPLQCTPAATEAMYLMMENAFQLGYRRYEWKCDALNQPSRAAALRLGFTFEGIFRQAAVVKGRNRDTAWYSILDGEWPSLRDAFSRWLAPENFDEYGRQRVRLSALTAAISPA